MELHAGLWAMHPGYLDAMFKRQTIEAMLPDAIRALASFGKEAAREADPIREGATVIVPIRGALSPRGEYGGTPTAKFADRMREYAADPKIGAIVLDIQSPGGLVWGTQEAGDAVYGARQAKPVVAVANPYAFSAAYWIGSQASAFYATNSGEVGSVGVRGGHVDQSGFEEKIGFKTTLIASSPEKIAAHPYAPLSEDDRAEIQAQVDEMNEAFTAAIARGRGMAASAVAGIHGSGKTFSAAKATASGAIDGVMTLRDVVAKYGSSRSRLALMRRQAQIRRASFAA